jgi:hypothetical protein
MSTDVEEVSSELSGDPKKRVHVLVYAQDWERLGQLYGSAVKRGNVIRMLLRDFLRRLEAKAEDRL